MLNLIYRPVSRFIHERWATYSPKSYIKHIYRHTSHHNLDLKNPKNYIEKLEWLKINSDITLWTLCADKYRVREYVTQCGFSEILVKLYGVWDNADLIDFENLPNRFVIKTNNAFARAIIVKSKSDLDIKEAKKQLNKWVRSRYGLMSFEPHYWNIERKIIAEEYLENSNPEISSSLIDYKIFCIHGEPQIIVVIYDREYYRKGYENIRMDSYSCVYDVDWNSRTDILAGEVANSNPRKIPKPVCLDEMLKVCRSLSAPFPVVRVDLYVVNDKVYFGELTFTPGANRDFFTPEYFSELGKKIDLSFVKRRSKRFVV